MVDYNKCPRRQLDSWDSWFRFTIHEKTEVYLRNCPNMRQTLPTVHEGRRGRQTSRACYGANFDDKGRARHHDGRTIPPTRPLVGEKRAPFGLTPICSAEDRTAKLFLEVRG